MQGKIVQRTPEEMKQWHHQQLISIMEAHEDVRTFDHMLSYMGFDCKGNVSYIGGEDEHKDLYKTYGVERPSDEELENIYRGFVWYNEKYDLAIISFDCGNSAGSYGGLFTTENVRKLVEGAA